MSVRDPYTMSLDDIGVRPEDPGPTTKEEDGRFIIVQGVAGPIFLGQGDRSFNCHACGFELIKGYEENWVIGVDLECFRCSAVTRTPPWPFARPLSQDVVVFTTEHHRARFKIADPILLRSLRRVTCEHEARRVANIYGPHESSHTGMSVTSAGVSEVIEKLDRITGHKLSWALEKTRRAQRAGNLRFVSYPLAWSLVTLEAGLRSGMPLNYSGDEGVALMQTQFALHLIGRWEHHPLFGAVAQGLVFEFHHTLTMMLAAASMASNGVQVGFNEQPLEGRFPDLFVYLSPERRVSIEVKAPSSLHWPSAVESESRLERIVEKQLKEARDQIVDDVGGIVVLGGSSNLIESSEALPDAVRSLERRGRISSRIAGVETVSFRAHPVIRQTSETMMTTEGIAKTDSVKNRKFSGQDFFKTGMG